MFQRYGCSEKIAQNLENLLSSSYQQRYDEIQKICFYFKLNSAFLNTLTAEQILNSSSPYLLQNSSFYVDTNKNSLNFEEYETLIKKSLNDDESLTCSKCGEVLEINARQLRKGDEGATIFVGCSNCKSRWKT